MRLWTIDPSYLDSKGLVALWRETLLAQKVLEGRTRGYTNHPQLLRFKESANPMGAIAEYLRIILTESENRGYHFDRSKINSETFSGSIGVSDSQVEFERSHLLSKLYERDIERYEEHRETGKFKIHPLFTEHEGDIESWEKGAVDI